MKTQTWERCVKEAKLLIMNRNIARLKVCELTIEACGNTTWCENISDHITVTEFAKDVGIHPKTLLEWLSIKKYIYDNLDILYQKNPNWSAMARTKRIFKKDEILTKTKVTSMYEDQLNERRQKTYNLLKYIKHLQYAVKKVTKKDLTNSEIVEIRNLCAEILSAITK